MTCLTGPDIETVPAREERSADPARARAAWKRWHREVWTVHMAEHEAFDCCEWRSVDDFMEAAAPGTRRASTRRPLEAFPAGA